MYIVWLVEDGDFYRLPTFGIQAFVHEDEAAEYVTVAGRVVSKILVISLAKIREAATTLKGRRAK